MGKKEDDSNNILKLLLESADDLDLSDPNVPKDQQKDPGSLRVPGIEMSKLLAVIEYAFLHAGDEDGILAGLNMMSRAQAIKAINGTFQLNIKPNKNSGLASDKPIQFYVDMRRNGEIQAGPGPGKPKPDVILTVTDKDMVDLALGKLNPQMAFLKGLIKVKGNVMLGLRMQNVLMSEVGKMQRVAKL